MNTFMTRQESDDLLSEVVSNVHAKLERLERIRETLHPTRPSYCAEPIDIDDARWLLALVDGRK